MTQELPSSDDAAHQLRIATGTAGIRPAGNYTASFTFKLLGRTFRFTHITPEEYERLPLDERPHAVQADDGPGYGFIRPL